MVLVRLRHVDCVELSTLPSVNYILYIIFLLSELSNSLNMPACHKF